jgi:hypothetical protein
MGIFSRTEYTHDIETPAPLFKKRSHRVPEVIVQLPSVLKVQLLPVTIHTLELAKAGDKLRL